MIFSNSAHRDKSHTEHAMFRIAYK